DHAARTNVQTAQPATDAANERVQPAHGALPRKAHRITTFILPAGSGARWQAYGCGYSNGSTPGASVPFFGPLSGESGRAISRPGQRFSSEPRSMGSAAGLPSATRAAPMETMATSASISAANG